MRRKIRIPAVVKLQCPEYSIDRIDGVIFYPLTGEVYLHNGKLIGIYGTLSETGILKYLEHETDSIITQRINVEFIKQKHRPMSESKNCPFHAPEDIKLINVGALKEFPDGKDNWCCPKCKRIWIDVDKEEWTTRVANVMMVKELIEGEQYADIVKVI